MGAWGEKTFQNDSSLEWLAELEAGGVALLRGTLSRVADTDQEDYLDVDDGTSAIAARDGAAESDRIWSSTRPAGGELAMIANALDRARPFHGSLLVAGLLAVMMSGCGSSSDGPCNAPLGEFIAYGLQLESAVVDWGLDAVPLHAAAIVSGSPAIGDCQLTTYPGHMPSPANATNCQRRNQVRISLDCVVTTENFTPSITRDYRAGWLFTFEIPSDPRTWTDGDVVAPAANFREHYPAYLWDAAGCQPPTIDGAPRGLPLVVEEAVGGIADYPQMVTPDYRRVFRIDFAETELLGACGGTATMTMSLRFAQTPADFSLTEMPCYLCR